MDKLKGWGLQYASQEQQEAAVGQIVDDALQTVRPLIIQVMLAFLSVPPATSFMGFELQLICLMRQLGRALLQSVVQSLESVDCWTAPRDLDFVGKTIASTGQSQQATLKIVKEKCNVSMGVKRLRDCVEHLAAAMKPLRQLPQVEALLEVLAQTQRTVWQ